MFSDEIEVMPGVFLSRPTKGTAGTQSTMEGTRKETLVSVNSNAPVSANSIDDMDAVTLQEEISRLKSECEMLLRSNSEIKEFMVYDPDPEYTLALAENVDAVNRRMRQIKAMQLRLKQLLFPVGAAAASAAMQQQATGNVGNCAAELLDQAGASRISQQASQNSNTTTTTSTLRATPTTTTTTMTSVTVTTTTTANSANESPENTEEGVYL